MNIMLSRQLGGIEQSFLDYKKLIELNGFQSINVISNRTKIANYLDEFECIPNFFKLDLYSIFKIRSFIKKYQPKFILAHGNRAITQSYFAKIGLNIPLVGVAHNYIIKSLLKCDHVISITEHLKQYLMNNNVPENQITVIPNSISITQDYVSYNPKKIITIGGMGRFVKKKAFDILLQAFEILKNKNIEFKAIIAGGGEEELNLKTLCVNLHLQNNVEFKGWVSNKEDFFNNIDIFCLPSTHEPFGIILLEAMAFSKPIITSNSEGPLEIIKDKFNGIFFKKNDAESLTLAIENLINDKEYCKNLGKNAYLSVREKYDTNNISKNFNDFLKLLL